MWRYLPLISRECCSGSNFGQLDNLENEAGHFLIIIYSKPKQRDQGLVLPDLNIQPAGS